MANKIIHNKITLFNKHTHLLKLIHIMHHLKLILEETPKTKLKLKSDITENTTE